MMSQPLSRDDENPSIRVEDAQVEDVPVEDFERGEVDPAAFTHREHVRMGYELLCRHDFPEALRRYSHGLRILVDRAKAQDKFNLTITVAFLSLIAERMRAGETGDFARFAGDHPELFDRGLLLRFYTTARLNGAQAKGTFLLPDRVPA
jgi:hypothetical protein